MNKEIEISVLMSVYNTNHQYLRMAIESILTQTFKNFEFLIIDDNSTDGSLEIIKEYKQKDNRIVLIENKNNIGLTKSLNKGLAISKGKYIARMDADDISLPRRLERQFKWMEENTHISVLGSFVFINKKAGLINRGFNENPEIDKIQMLFRNAGVSHPTAFFRKSFLDEHNIKYDESIKKSQDYAIWYECINNGGVIGRLSEILLFYRIHNGQISAASHEQMECSNMVTKKVLTALIGECSDEILKLHCSLVEGIPKLNKNIYISHLKILINKNEEKQIYSRELFKKQVQCIWIKLCLRRLRYNCKFDFLFSKETFSCLGLGVLKTYFNTYIRDCRKYKRIRNKYIATEQIK